MVSENTEADALGHGCGVEDTSQTQGTQTEMPPPRVGWQVDSNQTPLPQQAGCEREPDSGLRTGHGPRVPS